MKYTTVLVLASYVIVVIALNVDGTEAKRGCASFGHACYGGMGKRNNDDELTGANDNNNNDEEELMQNVVAQEENPQYVFTGERSNNNNNAGSNHNRRPSSAFSDDELREQLYHLSPFLRQWLRSYRKADYNIRK